MQSAKFKHRCRHHCQKKLENVMDSADLVCPLEQVRESNILKNKCVDLSCSSCALTTCSTANNLDVSTISSGGDVGSIDADVGFTDVTVTHNIFEDIVRNSSKYCE